MSLLGIVSGDPFHVRVGKANGKGWGCTLYSQPETWRVSAFRGGSVAGAARPPHQAWSVLSPGCTGGGTEAAVLADVFLGTMAPAGVDPFVRVAVPWAFVYEGSIEDVGGFQNALDPGWAIHPSLRTPGDLMFAHVLSYMVGVGALYDAQVALTRASRGIWRARALGSASFLYSNGDHLFAYSVEAPLIVASRPGAILIGSPDVVRRGPGASTLPQGALISISRRPQLGWVTTLVAGD